MDRELLREIVASIPHGAWMSYGDVARAAGGGDTHARTLNGRFIREEIPGAHRVLKSDGTVGATALGNAAEVRRRLESEGIEFENGRAPQSARIRPPEPDGDEQPGSPGGAAPEERVSDESSAAAAAGSVAAEAAA
jgi:alkylated DNA nucleotide flippase Atl1